jgi:uncharacterized protein YecE (DUF72 family)
MCERYAACEKKLMHETRIGISGWTYAPWRGTFYPDELRHGSELDYASRQIDSIEIYGSFYALQRPESYKKWYAATPEDFIFSVKATRYVTHIRRLNEIETPTANFFASGILALKEKLGPILWQFPPSMKFDAERFERFLSLLPRNTEEAVLLAEQHDAWMNGRSYVETDRKRKIHHAIEVRNESFRTPEFFGILKRHKAALVFSHSSDAWPYFEELTSDFVYARLHGEGELYSGGYGERALRQWAGKIREWSERRDVFLYFDNDVKVQAPFDAIELRRKLARSNARAA